MFVGGESRTGRHYMISEKTLEGLRQHEKELPRPLRILVHGEETRNEVRCSAMCLQYPVHAQAPTPDTAVAKLLTNLAVYLNHCARVKSNPWGYASPLYAHAFDRGRDLEVKNLLGQVHVRLSAELTRFLAKLESELEIKEGSTQELAAEPVPA